MNSIPVIPTKDIDPDDAGIPFRRSTCAGRRPGGEGDGSLTTMPMLANSTTASASRKPPMSFQPPSRLNLPPARTTRKLTSVASSTMVAKESRKPLLRHSEQKVLSSRQSSSLGKGRHTGSATEEQLSCRPRRFEKVEPVDAVTLYVTQCVVRSEVRVKAVAVEREKGEWLAWWSA